VRITDTPIKHQARALQRRAPRSEAEAAQEEREEGRRHKVHPERPWSWLRGSVPGGTGSPNYPEKKTLA
jgi:hypothetical protein